MNVADLGTDTVEYFEAVNDIVWGVGFGLWLFLGLGDVTAVGFRTELPIVGAINPHVPCDTSRVVSSGVTEPTLQRPAFVRQWPGI